MEPSETSRGARWRTTAFAVWAAIGVLVLTAVSLWFLWRIRAAIWPFVLAFLFVFLMNYPVRRLAARGVGRGTATLICFAIAILALAAVGLLIAPPLAVQLRQFSSQLPSYLHSSDVLFRRLQAGLAGLTIPSWLDNLVNQESSQIGAVVQRTAADSADFVLAAGSGAARGFIDFFLALVVSFWILRDLPTIREELRILAGERFRDDVDNMIDTVGSVVGGYLRGQSVASLVIATGVTIGLAVLGVPYALVVGIITFFFTFVPYVGPVLVGLITAGLALFGHYHFSPLIAALIGVVVVVLVQNLVDALLTPRLMSSEVNLHPSLVIFALLVGATLAGIPGMLLAIPVAATGKGLFVYYWERRFGEKLATEGGALFPTSEPTSATVGAEGNDDEFVEEM